MVMSAIDELDEEMKRCVLLTGVLGSFLTETLSQNSECCLLLEGSPKEKVLFVYNTNALPNHTGY